MAVLNKPDTEWQRLLTAAQFSVLRQGHDERRGVHPLIHEKARGTYVCAGCFNPLFESNAKFEHRDFPSFREANPGAVELRPGVGPHCMGCYCAHCGGYQGLVYNDGPQPTGKRYANNGEALLFVPRGTPLPAVRS